MSDVANDRRPPIDPLLVSIDEAARILGISRRELYRLFEEEQVESCKRGKRRLVLTESLRSLVKRWAEGGDA